MYYARWAKKKEIKDALKKIEVNREVSTAGVPVEYDDNKTVYIPNRDGHTLVIGATGSGKTQATILPEVKLSLLAGESIIVNDIKGEIYNITANNFKERGYKIYTIDFDDTKLGNNWNPLTLAYQSYKENELDRATTMLEELGYYLFTDSKEMSDPFWTNSVIDYFTGLALYLFENAKSEEININSIYNLANKLEEEAEREAFLNRLNKNSTIYFNVKGTLTSPRETRGGIIATFNQKIKKYISSTNLSNMLSYSDFDLRNINKEKTAIFVISGLTTYSNSLVPLLVNQCIEAIDIYGEKKKTNIILDEFESMLPILNFSKIINYARSISVNITVVIKSYLDLINTYGKENTEIIKSCFSNIIYLLSSDIYTLEEISKMCGNTEVNGKVKPLITEEELKTLKAFEAIILIPRTMPYKTTLIPDYKIEWNLVKKDLPIPKREIKTVNLYEEK